MKESFVEMKVREEMIGSFRLPTHRREVHRKFFEDPLLN